MTERTSRRAASAAPGLARATVGAALLVGAEQIVSALHQGPPPAGSVPLARLLGLRDVVQGAMLAARPRPAVRRLSLTVDLLHLATMLPVAVSAQTRRLGIAALVQASAATFCSLATGMAEEVSG